MSPWGVVKDFEGALCEYTGASYAVAVNSGTAAILLACHRYSRTTITLPSRTYVSVPCAVKQAGHDLAFQELEWSGEYRLSPLPVWDCARRFTSGMYVAGQFQCLSFAASKILSAEQGGAILHDNAQADAWFRRMRYDGRTEGVDPKDDTFDLIGHHCMMIPSVAAHLLLKLWHLPMHNEDMPAYPYPDLSLHPAFR